MTPQGKIPVTVIIVDSGPLISLAAADRLQLLMEFDRPIRVTDIVRAECLRFPEKIGGSVLPDWFAKGEGQFLEVIETPFLENWKVAVQREEQGEQGFPSRGIGDASIAWFIHELSNRGFPNKLTLLLSEDAGLGDSTIRIRSPEVYMLSTRIFLKTLENFGRIASASEVIRQVADAGREMARYAADRPGRLAGNARSTWTDVLSTKK